MGSSSFDSSAYVSRQTVRAATGTSAFAHTQSIRSGQAKAGVHDKLNPFGVKRESRDSDTHPESIPICVFFDVTGSMGDIPVTLQLKLGKLMEALKGNGYIDHPQIMFGAVGDAFTDRAPIQVGQFESGIEQDDDLANIFLEGNGGGNGGESYALPYYFVGKHTVTDAFEKRGKKGYLFTIGDEHVHPALTKAQIKTMFGDSVEADVTVEQAIAMAQETFEVFHLQVGGNDRVRAQWKALLGERALILDNPEAVTEVIASAIGILEGRTSVIDVVDDLVKAGFDANTAKSASRAVGVLKDVPRSRVKATSTGNLDILGPVGDVFKL